MEFCCVGSKKNTVKENSNVKRTKQNRSVFASKFVACGKRKSRFIKKGSRLLNKLGTRIPLSNIPLIGNLFGN